MSGAKTKGKKSDNKATKWTKKGLVCDESGLKELNFIILRMVEDLFDIKVISLLF